MTTPIRCGRRVAQGAGAAAAMAVLAGIAMTNHGTLAASVATLGHLRWIWIPAVIVLESASMAALAGMQRRLLAAGGARVRVRSMLATALAANALSVSVPLAGSELGTAFAFRRFTRQGADAPLAVWSLVVGGMMSVAAGALLVVGGGLSSGNIPVMVAAMTTGLLAAAVLAAVVAAARWPRMRGALEKPAAWMLQQGARLLRRPVGQPSEVIWSWAGRLGSLRLSRSGWITVAALALVNWFADAAVFAVSIQATGAAIPWHVLLLAYSSGVGAQTLNITPGGLGVTEGALGLTLVAAGLQASQALASVLLYRLVSFWLIASAGWLILFWLRRHRRSAATPAFRRRYPSPVPACHPGGPTI
jgi:putative heme transporter